MSLFAEDSYVLNLAPPRSGQMTIDIECTYTSQDYVNAQYLHISPRRWLYILVAGFLGFLMILFILATILVPAPTHKPHSNFPDLRTEITAVFLLFWFVFVWLYFGSLLPRRARRLFAQTKGLQLLNHFSFSSEGMTVENSSGKNLIPWDHFCKWRENQKLFLLYRNDIMFNMIPKRCITDEEQLVALRTMFESHLGRAN